MRHFVSRITRRVRSSRHPARRWSGEGDLRRRVYPSYEAYLSHQASKLSERRDTAERFNEALRQHLPDRLADLELAGAKVVCVAARLGGEVQVFRDRGAFAVGVDIEPGPGNPWVLFGDMHNLEQFADGVADVVYCNSLDHAYDVAKVALEVQRLLAPSGVWIVEAMKDDGRVGDWEVTAWSNVDELITAIERDTVLRAVPNHSHFDEPWPGEHIRFVIDGTMRPSS